MFEVFFYRDKKRREPVLDYIRTLLNKEDRTSRTKANRLLDCIDYLREVGAQAREPYAQHLDGDIWKLQPILDTVIYAVWNGQSFILLHCFQKATQNTTRRKTEQAKHDLGYSGN